ncbi:uncharacterized protein LOC142163595 isoform X2 [Nicotiana tabacum]|uniref:Uncharacterized protein LOC142163595 isoform X2 n=2 Tax=Nicotiana TaxID=4085 RepID=A0AC58RW63_TOBAC|nr:PREDICTED: uncharacterized protein LOC104228833 isoform X4 [Nicotiana sylvestris]
MTWNSTQVGNLRGGKTGKTILACVITTCPHQNFKLLVICLHFLLQTVICIVLSVDFTNRAYGVGRREEDSPFSSRFPHSFTVRQF